MNQPISQPRRQMQAVPGKVKFSIEDDNHLLRILADALEQENCWPPLNGLLIDLRLRVPTCKNPVWSLVLMPRLGSWDGRSLEVRQMNRQLDVVPSIQSCLRLGVKVLSEWFACPGPYPMDGATTGKIWYRLPDRDMSRTWHLEFVRAAESYGIPVAYKNNRQCKGFTVKLAHRAFDHDGEVIHHARLSTAQGWGGPDLSLRFSMDQVATHPAVAARALYQSVLPVLCRLNAPFRSDAGKAPEDLPF